MTAGRHRRAVAARAATLGLALLASEGCFATRSDVLVLQGDIATVRTEVVRTDSVRAAQLERVIAALGAATDSLTLVSGRVARMQGDAQDRFYAMEQQLLQIQELTGQSQRRLQELRAEMEQRNRAVAPAPVTTPQVTPAQNPPVQAVPAQGSPAPGVPAAVPPATAAAGAPTANAPGPNELFQRALDQFRRGSTGAARAGFQDLLTRFPSSDVASDAQFYIAEAFATERDAASADSAYALVVSRYPESARAPTALYKRAVAFEVTGRTAQARAALDEVIRRYPRSDEAVLARERLRIMK